MTKAKASLRWRLVVAFGRALIRALGWKIRGQMPPQFWRTTVVVWAPKAWQKHAMHCIMPNRLVWLPEPPDKWELRAKDCEDHFELGQTNATLTSGRPENLMAIQRAALQSKSRITLCAWESNRRFLHIHAPFKVSTFADRDVHYMARYFKYFAGI